MLLKEMCFFKVAETC